jgi:hypothetical protein
MTMNRKTIRVFGASLLLLGLAACGSQESEFVEVMTEKNSTPEGTEIAECAYGKILDSKGEEFIAEFLDGIGKGMPKGAFTVAGAIASCTAELG